MNVNAIDTEKFIEIVKSHPPLYNTEHRLFKNVAKKNEIWEQVAKELNEPNIPIEVLRTKWKGLKDGYTKYRKWQMTGCASAKYYSNWCWASNMVFVEPFINVIRKRKETYSASENGSAYLHMEGSDDEHLKSNAEELCRDTGNYDETTENECLIKTEPVESTATSPSTSRSQSQASLRDPITTEPDDSSKLLGFMQKKRSKGIDAVDLLFMSYADTFKKFSVLTQTKLKVKMATIFAEAELQEHNLDHNVLSRES